MSEVDERIVRLAFDNTGFEAGATKAIGVLEKLSSALNFKDTSEGLENVKNSLSNLNTSSITSGLSEAGRSFSVFEQIGIGALRRIGEEVAGLGIKLVNSLRRNITKGARDGFGEYELQMKSLQTISANSGESMEVIKENLNELNEYADKTIYNFSEMTANIGRFTAAGLGVEESTSAIKGFANMAALAGAGTQETSRGMYQLSQAMAAGVVKLQDWKSIQNASIDTAAFKDILIETARAMDLPVDAAIKKQGSFNASLQDGWLTADVMSQALQVATMSTRDFADEEKGMEERLKQLVEMGYTEDVAKKLVEIANAADDSAREVRTWTQLVGTIEEAIGSGWAKTWELIIGDFDEATELFTTISQKFDAIVGASADARNGMLAEWKKAGGRDALVGIFANIFEAITRIAKPIKDAFDVWFGIGGEQLAVLTENVALFTQSLVINEDVMNLINKAFGEVFDTAHSLIGILFDLGRYALEAFDVFGLGRGLFIEFFEVLYKFGSRVSRTAWDLWKMTDGIGVFIKSFSGLSAVPLFLFDTISGAISGIVELFRVVSHEVSLALKTVWRIIKTAFSGKFFSNIGKTVSNIVDIFAELGKIIIPIIRALLGFGRTILVVISPIRFALRFILDVFSGILAGITGILVSILAKVRPFVETFLDIFYRINRPIRRIFKEVYSIIRSFYIAIRDTIFGSSLFRMVSDIFGKIKKRFTDLVNAITSPLGKLEHSIAWYFIHPIKKLKDLIVDFGGNNRVRFFKQIFEDIGNVIGGPFRVAFDLAKTAVSELYNVIKPFIDSAASFLSTNVKNPFEFLSGLNVDFSFLDGLKNLSIPDILTSSLDNLAGLFGSIAKNAKKSTTWVKNFVGIAGGKKAKKLNKTGISTYLESIKKWVSDLKTYFSDLKNSGKSFGEIVAKVFGDIYNSIREWLRKLSESNEGFSGVIAGIFGGILDTISGMAGSIKDGLSGLFSGSFSFGDIFSGLKEAVSGGIENLPDTVKSLFDQIVSTFTWGKERIKEESGKISFDNIQINLSSLGSVVGTAISSFVDGILQVPEMAGNVFDDILGKAQEFISGFPSFDKIADTGDLLLKGGLIASLIKFVNSFSGINKSIIGLADSIKKWPTALENGLKGFGQQFGKYESKADAILKVAAAMAILAGSLFLLASIPADDLVKAGKAMGALALGLLMVVSIFEALEKAKFFNPAMLTAVGAAFSGVAIGVLALAAAALVLSFIPEDKLSSGMTTIVQLMTIISIYALSLRTNGKSLLLGSIGLIILAKALHSFIGVIERLADIKTKKLNKGVDAFVKIMATLSLFGAVGAKGIGVLLSSFLKFGVGVLALSISLGFLAVGLKTLSDSLKTMDNLWVTIGIAAGFIVLFVGACALLKECDPIGVGVGLLIFSASILVMAAALAGLSAVATGDRMGSLVASVVSLLALVAVFGILAKVLDPKAAKNIAISLAIFSGAIAVMSVALSLLASMDTVSVIASTVCIAALIGVFGLIAKFVDPVSIQSSASAMLIFAAAITVMSAAFKILETVNIMSVIPSLIAIMAMFGTFALAATALAPAAVGIYAISHALAVFSIAVLGIAAAFWLFSAAIVNLNSVGPEQTANLLAGFGEGLGSILDQLIARMPDFIQALVTGLINGISYLIDAAVQLVTALYNYIVENRAQMVAAGIELLKKIGEGIQNGLSWIAAQIPVIIDFFVNNFAPFMSSVLEVGKTFIKTVVSGAEQILPDLAALGGTIVSTVLDGITSLFGTVAQTGIDFAKTIWSNVCNFLGIASPSTLMTEVGNNTVQGLINGISDGSLLSTLGSAAASLGQAISNGIGNLGTWLKEKADAGLSLFGSVVGGYSGNVGAQAGLVRDSAVNALGGVVTGASNSAISGAKAFVSGIGSQDGQIKSKSKAMVTNASNPLKELKSLMQTRAKDGVNAFVSALAKGAGSARSATRALMNGARSGLGSLRGSFHQVGYDAGIGFANGINSTGGYVYRVAYQLGVTAIRAAKAATREHSPSKVFHEIGYFVGEGFILGMKSEIPKTYKMGTKLAETVPTAFEDTLSALSLNIDDLLETDYNPVITPVINSTEFDSGMYRLSSAINSRLGDISVGNLNYTGELSSQLSDYNDINRRAIDLMASNTLDYNLLGVAVANALINAGVHVEMDGGQLMGYLAGEISDARRMYGTR